MEEDIVGELRHVFLQEARDLLEKVEASLIAFDGGDQSETRIDDIFRVAHSFKGSARSVGFDSLASFAHKMEDMLSRLKSKTLSNSAVVTDCLFQCVDILGKYTSGLEKDLNFTLDTGAVEHRISELMNGPVENQSDRQVGYGIFDDGEAVRKTEIIKFPHKEKVKHKSDSRDLVMAGSSQTPPHMEGENLRVPLAKLDALLNVVGELVVNYNMLMDHRQRGTVASEHALHTMGYTLTIVKEIQDIAMSLRMVSIKPLMQKLQRAVRDVSNHLGKKVTFRIEGDHVELEKTVLEAIADPLTHLVRNAVDHGLESTGDRLAAGKSEQGLISLDVRPREDQVEITIADDGRGIDREKVLAKATESGLIDSERAAFLSHEEVNQLLLMPGFSTKSEVTEISGRGVGLDVVKRSIEDLKGTLHISSEAGKGTKFTIVLPQSFSIIGGMVVDVDKRKYIIPVSQLVETIELKRFAVETVTGRGRVINIRGQVVPVLSLGEILHGVPRSRMGNDRDKTHRPCLVTIANGKRVSFEVDEIEGQQQVVLKKLGHEMRQMVGISAGAILSSGDPGLVIDLVALAKEKVHAG